MTNKNVCPKCGQIYNTDLAKCPLCGAAAPTSEAEPAARPSERTTQRGGKYLSKEDKKKLEKEEEAFLREEEARYKRLKRQKNTDETEEDTDTRIPAGFIVASVIILAAALLIGGSFLLWKADILHIGLYDRLAGKNTEPTIVTTEATLPITTEDTTEVETTEVTEPTDPPVELPFEFDINDPVLVLVNDDNPVPEDYPIDDLVALGSGAKVNRLCMDDLQEMVNACRGALHYPRVFAGYDERAEATNEYCTGIAVDIFPEGDPARDVETQKESETLIWLWEHCYEYGFIVRYPEGKEDITGHDFEPWHFRYVGKDVAAYMHENDLCFEEMADLLSRAAG